MSRWEYQPSSINTDGPEIFADTFRAHQKSEMEHVLVHELCFVESGMRQWDSLYQKSNGREVSVVFKRDGVNMSVVLSVLEKSSDEYGNTAFLERYEIEASCLGCDGIRGISYGSVNETVGERSATGLQINFGYPGFTERLEGSQYLIGLERATAIFRKIHLDMLGQTAPKA